METKEMVTKEMIQNSMEAKWRKRFMILFASLLGVYVILMLGVLINEEAMREIGGIMWFPAMVLAFRLVYDTVRYFMLFLHRDSYECYEVMLERPTSSLLFRGYIYFTIEITTKSGMNIFRKTKPIWCDYPLSQFKTWEYMNSNVLIAYDEERDRLVVLGTE